MIDYNFYQYYRQRYTVIPITTVKGPCSMFYCALLCVHSSFAIILMLKRGLIALVCFRVSIDCCVTLPHGATGLSAVSDCGIS